MKEEYQYSLALALFDFVPVIFSSIGLILIARMIAAIEPKLQRIAQISVVMIIIGGTAKVTWKTLIAAFDINFMALNHSLFIFMAPGFTLLTYALILTRRSYNRVEYSSKGWLWPAGFIAVFALTAGYLAINFPDKRFWFLSLLVLLTVANMVFIWHAVRHAWQIKQKGAGVLFIVNLVGIFLLSYLARQGDQSEAAQWLAEILNSITQGALALGAYWLYRATSREVENAAADVHPVLGVRS
ncbi:hypothetical protein [Thalassotalea mangrovi]|uniref:Uncharacterized protein n=1 Tax=Thalassotalea mangrovi TaxID=2572245 RepID=A0A4U1B6B3_9GAMM|nr:hypothetical protein [Thalassotalea mangrovi]TKB46071.1 hypothetical protein E8M12_05430 [Thalassotalea mangrovi]